MGEHELQPAQQPLLFMNHGIDQPFNTRADRTKIARHLSKRFHRQKRKPLYEKAPEPRTKVVEYPVSYYHGGKPFPMTAEPPALKKRKLALKIEEDVDQGVIATAPFADRSPVKKTESEVTEAACECRRDLFDQQRTNHRKENTASSGRVVGVCQTTFHRHKQMQTYTPPPTHIQASHKWPFDSSRSIPIHIDGCVLMIIDYFLKQWAPDFDRDYKLSGYNDPHLSIVFPLAMDHAVLLQSLVAMCRVFWLMAEDRPWQEESEYLKHRGRALALVQAKLECEIVAGDATLLAIVCLTSIELLASNHTAVIAHAKGLKLLVDSRQDEQDASTTSQYAKASARAHAMVGKYIRHRDPSFGSAASSSLSRSSSHSSCPGPTYHKHPFDPDVCRSLSNIPVGFCNLAMTGCLSLESISIIESLSIKAEEWSIIRMSADVDSELNASYHLRSLEGKTPTEDFLVYGFISFCNQFPDKFENRNPFFNIALKCLDDGMEARKKLSGLGNQPWLVWMTMVVTGALEICAQPLDGRHMILDSLLEECDESHDWGWIEDIMRTFLWTDKLGGHWRRCWEEGMRRWDERSRSSRSTTSSASTSTAPSDDGAVARNQVASLAELLRDSYELNEAYMQAGIE